MLFKRIYYLDSKGFSFEKVRKDLIKEFLKTKPNKYYSILILTKTGLLNENITILYRKEWYNKEPINNQIINKEMDLLFNKMGENIEYINYFLGWNYSFCVMIKERSWYNYYYYKHYLKIKIIFYIFIFFIFILFIYYLKKIFF
jgi:hypothetical protein